MGDRGEGRQRPKRWEVLEEETRWCPECRTYTEHDAEGCVDCGIREHFKTVITGSQPHSSGSSGD